MVSYVCEVLQTRVCPPPTWAHHQHGTAWQSHMDGLAIPSCVRIAKVLDPLMTGDAIHEEVAQ